MGVVCFLNMSSFLSGDRLLLGFLAHDVERDKVFPRLLFVVPVSVVSAGLFCLAMSQIL